MQYVLGIDIGTGSIKAVAVEPGGKIIYSSQDHYPSFHTQPGFSEQDPQTIFEAFIHIINSSVSEIGKMPACISLSSAMHSMVAVDKHGDALTQLMLWSDSRSASIAERIKNSKDAKDIYERTGTPIHSMSPLCKIIWLKEEQPQIFQQASKFISIKEYIWYKLFRDFNVDHSVASGSGLFDIEKKRWYEKALELAGISAQHLSEPVSTGYTKKGLCIEIASQLEIAGSTPFCIGATDGCLANLGSNSMDSNTAAITIGTSGAVRIAQSKPLLDFSMMSFNYILDENSFICGGPVNNGGNVLDWLLKKFISGGKINHDHNMLFDLVEKTPPGSRGLIFLPFLHGERAPVWDDQSLGVFFGITSSHDQPYFLRAALEGVCFSLYNILEKLEQASHPIQQINVSGGFVRSGVWVQILADITGKNLCLLQNEDASATGAAYMGLKAIGATMNYGSFPQSPKNEIQPRQQFAATYENNYRIFKNLYPALKESMHLLHQVNNGKNGLV